MEEELKKKTVKIMKKKKAFREELGKRLSAPDRDKVWRNAHKRLYRMYAEHRDLSKGVRMHTDSFIFPAAAIYLAMKDVDSKMAYDVMKKLMAVEQGCPELNILFCENDVHVYGNLPGLKFSRKCTIGAGDSLCDFKMEII